MTDDLFRQFLSYYRDLGVKTIYRAASAAEGQSTAAQTQAAALPEPGISTAPEPVISTLPASIRPMTPCLESSKI